MFLELTDVASHLRLPNGGLDADELPIYMAAACAMLEELTGATYTTEDVPPRVKVAALLLVGDFFENRESSTALTLRDNPAFIRLVMPHRSF